MGCAGSKAAVAPAGPNVHSRHRPQAPRTPGRPANGPANGQALGKTARPGSGKPVQANGQVR